eukprot:SAG31_NODE_5115_length_2731_cov_15.741261_2_plen_80_part_01
MHSQQLVCENRESGCNGDDKSTNASESDSSYETIGSPCNSPMMIQRAKVDTTAAIVLQEEHAERQIEAADAARQEAERTR